MTGNGEDPRNGVETGYGDDLPCPDCGIDVGDQTNWRRNAIRIVKDEGRIHVECWQCEGESVVWAPLDAFTVREPESTTTGSELRNDSLTCLHCDANLADRDNWKRFGVVTDPDSIDVLTTCDQCAMSSLLSADRDAFSVREPDEQFFSGR